MPSVGTLQRYRRPSGEHIRVDDGIEEGMEVPIYYDPLLAKLAVWGVTREAAIKRMLEAIQQYQIEGVATTLPFGRFVCEHEAFISGKFDTGFVKNHYTPEGILAQQKEEAEVAARLALEVLYHHKRQLAVPDPGGVEWYTQR